MGAEDYKAIALEVVSLLADKGLVLTTADAVDTVLQLQKAQARIMRRNKMTPYEVAKFKLLPGNPSLSTIKNMISDGRIKKTEYFFDSNNKLYITRACVARLKQEI